MINSKYIPVSVVIGGTVIGLGIAYALQAYPQVRLLVILGFVGIVSFLLWRSEV